MMQLLPLEDYDMRPSTTVRPNTPLRNWRVHDGLLCAVDDGGVPLLLDGRHIHCNIVVLQQPDTVMDLRKLPRRSRLIEGETLEELKKRLRRMVK